MITVAEYLSVTQPDILKKLRYIIDPRDKVKFSEWKRIMETPYYKER